MALLNYTAPFLNIPTQAPYFTQQPVHQPHLLYGVPPPATDQSHPNSPYRNSQPSRPNQYPQKQQQTQTTTRNSKVQQQFFGNYDRRTNDKNPRGFPSNFPKNSPQGFVKQNYEDRSGYNVDNSRTTDINEQLTYNGPPPGGISNARTGVISPDNGDRDSPGSNNNNNNQYPVRPIEYKRIDPDSQKTSIHPIIDYDNDYEYYDDDEGNPVHGKPLLTTHITPLHVAPIQGPIFLKNGTIPVVPLYSYPVLNNGTFFQIPILWTALSVALGLELRGEIIRGVPCIKRYYQLFCPTAGNSYPIDRIELFIDENKALMKRMYGDFTMSPGFGPPRGRKKKRSTTAENKKDVEDEVSPPGVPDLHSDPGPDPVAEKGRAESYFSKLRNSRQSSSTSRPFRTNQSNESGRLDACESKVEIITPYWASNSAGKIRAVVNTQHFEQAIHQEVCSKMSTSRCSGDCGCEQKYKWHRLLAYDPDDDCKGIFMDWFLFPSCCVCRCNPT